MGGRSKAFKEQEAQRLKEQREQELNDPINKRRFGKYRDLVPSIVRARSLKRSYDKHASWFVPGEAPPPKRCSPGSVSTWEIVQVDGEKHIRFSPCGWEAYAGEEVTNRYCGYCDRYWDEMCDPADFERLWAVELEKMRRP